MSCQIAKPVPQLQRMQGCLELYTLKSANPTTFSFMVLAVLADGCY